MIPKVAVVLAGGLGTRISAVADGKPKVLLDVAGKPFIRRKLDELARNGVTGALLLLGYGAEQVTEWLNSNPSPIVVACVVDGPTLQGTGGALLDALPLLPEFFYLTYGDSLLELDYGQLAGRVSGDARKRSCLAVTRPQAFMDGRCNTAVHGGRVVAHSKVDVAADMHWLDYGLSLLRKNHLRRFAKATRPLDLSVLYDELSREDKLLAYETVEPYLEIGTPESLEHVRQSVHGVGPLV